MMGAEQPEDKGYTTVRMTVGAHEAVVKEAKRFKLKNIDYMDAAIRYFALRGLNPVEVEAREGTLIMKQVQRLGDRLFAYMQEEEQGVLVPMLEELIRVRLTTERILRLEEVLLSTLPEEEMKRKKDKVEQLRLQNETAIQEQIREVLGAGRSMDSVKRGTKKQEK
ncbi:hypothetical protein [Sabulibacter ruber]|uniref:hypothetical protein n=1 Tax=Sabulibacter ruber TaxID=2811901 RepID=UPI001A970F12|nr:hypothetical protein [Sabulibacter ruber]